MKYSKMRPIVAGVVFLSVIIGLVFHTGTGTPSALGWRDIAAICPVGALEVLAGAKAFLVHPIVLLCAALIIGTVVGKAFCAWACPVPHIRSFFRPKKKNAAGSEEEHPREKRDDHSENDAETPKQGDACASCGKCAAALEPIGGKRDGMRLDSRHATLIGAVVSSFAFGFPVFCLICPVGLSFAVAIGIWNLFRFNETSWGLIVFPVLLPIEVVFFRKWCTKFCPISALLSLLSSHGRLLRPRVDKNACLRSKGVACTACVHACPEQVDPHSASIPECSRCGACVEACPAKAISMPLMHNKNSQAAPSDGAMKGEGK